MFATLQVTVADGRRAAPTSTPLHTVITRKLTSLPWCSRGLLLEVTLHNLLNLDDTLLLASRRLDAVQCVRGLDEHSLVNDDVLLVPLCRKPVAWSVQPSCLSKYRDVRPADGVKDLLCLSAHTLALLFVPLLHLTDCLLLSCQQRCHVHLRDAGDCAVEACICLLPSFTEANDLEGQYVCEGDDVIVAGLRGERGGRVRRRRRGVDRNCVCGVACCKEGALNDIVVGRACDLDTVQRQSCCSAPFKASRLYSLSKGSIPRPYGLV
jgi:hypothetical protein